MSHQSDPRSDPSIKIGMLTHWLSPRGGGVYEVVRSLSLALQRDDVEIAVLGLSDHNGQAEIRDHEEPTFKAVPTRGPRMFGFAPTMRKELRSMDPDILHVHGLFMFPSILSLGWAKQARSPLLISPHGMLEPWALNNSAWKKKIAMSLVEREHLGLAGCVHALSEAEAESLRNLGVSVPVAIIPNGVDLPKTLSRQTKANAENGCKTLLYIGRIHPKKNLLELLRAWRRLKEWAGFAEWRLSIVGWDEQGYLSKLKAEVHDGNIPDVDFSAPVFGAQKEACFRNAHALILPSLSEGVPMVVLEAWSYGIPVLMTQECNLPIGFASNAAMSISASGGPMADDLKRFFSIGDEDRERIGLAGRSLVENHYTWTRVANDFLKTYRWLLGRGDRPDFMHL